MDSLQQRCSREDLLLWRATTASTKSTSLTSTTSIAPPTPATPTLRSRDPETESRDHGPLDLTLHVPARGPRSSVPLSPRPRPRPRSNCLPDMVYENVTEYGCRPLCDSGKCWYSRKCQPEVLLLISPAIDSHIVSHYGSRVSEPTALLQECRYGRHGMRSDERRSLSRQPYEVYVLSQID